MSLVLLALWGPIKEVRADEPPPEDAVVAGRVLLKPKAGVEASVLGSSLSSEGVQVTGSLPKLGYLILSVPLGKEREWAQRLAGSPLAEHAQPDFVYHLLDVTPNDYYFSAVDAESSYLQWNLRAIKAPKAWDITTGSEVVIAIVDTGVDDRHDDLRGRTVPGADFVNEDNPFDGLGAHGTHVAGIAAARANNYYDTPNAFPPGGIAGVSWGAKVMSVKVANHFGKAKDSDAVQGIVYAADHGAQIINLSFGGQDYSQILQDAINYAYNKGALVVAAAGNCGDPNTYTNADCTVHNPPIYPAANQNVLAVGAIDKLSRRAAFSEYGSYVAVAAPGKGILSTLPNQRYGVVSGTSQAAPHASALASLIWSVNPNLTNAQVANIMTSTAADLGPAGKDDEFGYGLTDAYAALVKASAPSPTPTLVPALALNPSALGFLAKPAATGVMARSLRVSTGSSTLPWSATLVSPASWLSISPISGTTPATITVSMNRGSLGAGQYQSGISVSAPGAQPSQASVPVTLVLTDTLVQWYVPLAMVGRAAGW